MAARQPSAMAYTDRHSAFINGRARSTVTERDFLPTLFRKQLRYHVMGRPGLNLGNPIGLSSHYIPTQGLRLSHSALWRRHAK